VHPEMDCHGAPCAPSSCSPFIAIHAQLAALKDLLLPQIKTFMCNTCQLQNPEHPGASDAVKSTAKQRAAAIDLLQYAHRYPHMVTQVEWSIPRMAPDPVLFPESTTLRQEPPCSRALDPRRGDAWDAITTRFADVFAKPSRLPPYRFVNGSCALKDEGTVPPRAGVGRLSREEITYTRAILCDYLDKGWIRPSYSRTASRLFFVTKPNGGLRSVVDYRAVNDALKTKYFPPPTWSNIVSRLGDSAIFSTFDCSDLFFQVRMRDEDAWLTAFSTCFGQFEWRVCPQGLASSPAVAQQLFSGILQSLPNVNADLSINPVGRRNLLEHSAEVFLEDVLIHGGTFEDHLNFVWSFMYAMEEQQLHLSAPRAQFMQTRCNYLGHVLSAEGVAVQPERVSALRKWPTPASTADVQAFLGFCVYLRRHIENFGTYAAPLSALTSTGTDFSWGPAQQTAFETLRDICCSPQVLATPRPGLPYQLRCDASGYAAGQSLWQLHTLPDETTIWRPIEFRSKSFNEAARSQGCTHARTAVLYRGIEVLSPVPVRCSFQRHHGLQCPGLVENEPGTEPVLPAVVGLRQHFRVYHPAPPWQAHRHGRRPVATPRLGVHHRRGRHAVPPRPG